MLCCADYYFVKRRNKTNYFRLCLLQVRVNSFEKCLAKREKQNGEREVKPGNIMGSENVI